MPFRESSAEEFATIVAAKASDTFKRHYARVEPSIYEGWENKPDFQLHGGPMHYAADLKAPALCTLVDGDLVVEGLLDHQPVRSRLRQSGLFVVLGSIRCQSLAGEAGKCVFVDGNVTARDFMLTCHEDSGFWVLGHLAARFLLASDTWPYVGDGASIEHGDGACLDLDSHTQIGSPLRDRASAALIIGVDDLDEVDAVQLVDDIRAGKVFFADE